MELIPERKEILRYLGYRGVVPDEAMLQEIDDCVRELNEAVTPRFVYERFPLSRTGPDDTSARCAPADNVGADNVEEQLCFAGIRVSSRDLSVNLRDCSGVCMMAVTLGPGPDILVRRASLGRMSRAVIYQAAATAMTEVWCDQVNERIRLEAEKDGLYTRPRFSPGYGDLPLTLQKEFSRILNMPKEIGVSLTDSLLMTPSKSVTALIGLSNIPGNCRKKGCAECAQSDTCSYAAGQLDCK